MVTETEKKILERYSTPGLRRNQLGRGAKKDHLASLKVVGERAEKILDELYPEESDDRSQPPRRSEP